MKLDGMNPAPPVTKTRFATRAQVTCFDTNPGRERAPRLRVAVPLARDFLQSPVRVVIVDDHRLFVDALALLLGHDERLEVIGTASDTIDSVKDDAGVPDEAKEELEKAQKQLEQQP